LSRNNSHLSFPVSGLTDKIVPILLGVAAFFLVVGPGPLQVSNISWLTGSDPAQHYLGWAFYRQSPWGFPLGINPGFGLELGSSIFYSDSLPLFAFLFKSFSSFLPATFQYIGLWLLFCFILQAWFAWRLIGLMTDDVALRLPATAFFLFSPPMLWLLHGHDALFGHWLILAGLYICLAVSLQRRQSAWFVLTFLAALVHSYLLAMVLCLWLSDLSRRLIIKECNALSALRDAVVIVAGVVIALWQAGFFLVKSGYGGKGGYGYYSLNVLSLINSAASGFIKEQDDWSYFLPGFPHLEGTGDLVFLGSGVLIMVVLAAPFLIRKMRGLEIWPTWSPLLLVLGGLTLFALSNNIAIGTVEFKLPLPSFVLNAAQMLRCSARMFWPVYYVIYLTALYLVIKSYSKKRAVLILSSLLVLQVADTSSGWMRIKDSHATVSTAWPSPFKSEFWSVAAKRYRNVRVLPPGDNPRYADIAYFAATHGMGTDAAYLARYDSRERETALRKSEASLATGAYDAGALYIVDRSQMEKVLTSARSEEDLVAIVDDFLVIAPGWKQCPDCPQPPPLKGLPVKSNFEGAAR